MRSPKAILFDLDDTLLSHSIGKELLLRELCQRYGPLLQVNPSSLRQSIDQAADLFWGDPGNHRRGRLDLAWAKDQIVSLGCGDLGVPYGDAAKAMAAEFYRRRSDFTKPFAGAIETLKTLRQTGVLLGLLTNGASAVQRAKIEKHQLGGLFDAVWIEEERSIGKPSPAAYLGLLQELGSEAQATWMVGDHLEWEVAASQVLGLYSVWVDHRRMGLPVNCGVKPDRIIHNVSELVA